MWTKEQIQAWCKERATLPHRITDNTDSFTRYVWEDGSTYAFCWLSYTVRRKVYRVEIDGAAVFEGVSE